MFLAPRGKRGDVYTISRVYENKCILFRQRHRPMLLENEKESRLPKNSAPEAFSLAAGMTVEAALALPVFLLLCALFFTFFHGQMWQMRFQKNLDEICEDVSVWSYVVSFAEDYTGTNLMSLADGGKLSGALEGKTEDIKALLSGKTDLVSEIGMFLAEKGSALLWQALLKEWLIAKVGRDALESSLIRDGADGLSLSGSTLHGRDLDLVLSYRVRSLFSFPLQLDYPIVQRCCRRLWIGTPVRKAENTNEEEMAEEAVAYVTANGSVYHLSRECRVLALRMETVPFATVGSLRNTSGGKYYPCKRCTRGEAPPVSVIITVPGTRYHFSADCPSLIRYITEMALSEAQEKYRACHYCGGGQ